METKEINEKILLKTSENNMMCLIPAKPMTEEEEQEMLEALQVC